MLHLQTTVLWQKKETTDLSLEKDGIFYIRQSVFEPLVFLTQVMSITIVQLYLSYNAISFVNIAVIVL